LLRCSQFANRFVSHVMRSTFQHSPLSLVLTPATYLDLAHLAIVRAAKS